MFRLILTARKIRNHQITFLLPFHRGRFHLKSVLLNDLLIIQDFSCLFSGKSTFILKPKWPWYFMTYIGLSIKINFHFKQLEPMAINTARGLSVSVFSAQGRNYRAAPSIKPCGTKFYHKY